MDEGDDPEAEGCSAKPRREGPGVFPQACPAAGVTAGGRGEMLGEAWPGGKSPRAKGFGWELGWRGHG